MPRFCPFCGDPYRAAGEPILTPVERALLVLVEAESEADVDLGGVLRGLIARGLVHLAVPVAEPGSDAPENVL